MSNLVKYFPITKGVIFSRTLGNVRAVENVSFEIAQGETLGLVGESGPGKTTIAKLVMRLIESTSGKINFEGSDVTNLDENNLKEFRKRTAMVFQDPYASLDPRKRIESIISEPMVIQKSGSSTERKIRVREILSRVGLSDEDMKKYPHQFSGGQRQRIGIGRALALSPQLLVLDEPVSALDVSVQASIINLLMDLQQELRLSYLLIAHDLSVVRQISKKVAIMYLGKIMEFGDSRDVFTKPLHPYTQALLKSIPLADYNIMKERDIQPIMGEIPSAVNPPSGCRFRTRCLYAQNKCAELEPSLEEIGNGHLVACHFWNEISLSLS